MNTKRLRKLGNHTHASVLLHWLSRFGPNVDIKTPDDGSPTEASIRVAYLERLKQVERELDAVHAEKLPPDFEHTENLLNNVHTAMMNLGMRPHCAVLESNRVTFTFGYEDLRALFWALVKHDKENNNANRPDEED